MLVSTIHPHDCCKLKYMFLGEYCSAVQLPQAMDRGNGQSVSENRNFFAKNCPPPPALTDGRFLKTYRKKVNAKGRVF